MVEKKGAELSSVLDYIKGIDLESIRFVFCDMVDKGMNWNLTKHSHDVVELIYLIDAAPSIHASDQVLSPTWCDVIVYPPHHMHQEYLDTTRAQKCVYVQFDVKSKYAMDKPFKIKDTDRTIYWLMQQIWQQYKVDVNPKRSRLIKTYLQAILLHMEQYLMAIGEKPDIVAQTVQYIEHNYHEELSVEKLAKMSYVTASYLSRLFKHRLDTTPMNYVGTIRIEAAKRLLCFSKESVGEIAASVGIEDPKYFSRLFKKLTGDTPLAYRKKHADDFVKNE